MDFCALGEDLDDDVAAQYVIHQSLRDVHRKESVIETMERNSTFSLSPEHEKIVAAIRNGAEEVLGKLCCHQSAFLESDARGWTPLHEAAVQINKNILEMAFKSSSHSAGEPRTARGETPLFLAVDSARLENVTFLLSNGCDPDAKNDADESPLVTAIRRGSYDIASLLLRCHTNVDLPCADNRTALHEAAKLGKKDMTGLLLRAGADPNFTSNFGFTPLALAAQHCHTDVMEMLIQKGASVMAQASDSASILFEASAAGNPDAVSLLLEYGADANIPKHSGHLPIHRAAYRGHLLALRLLVPVTNHAAIRRSGISPIHSAAAGAHPQCLDLLIRTGFDVNFMLAQRVRKGYDDERKSALYFAVSNGDVPSANLLLEAGALPNRDPVNCLQVALRMGNYELVDLLLRHGANVNYVCRVNPLHFPSALQYALKDEVLLRMLLNYGYDVRKCFDCPYGDNVHTPYGYEGWTSTVIKDTVFCEVISVTWLRHLGGNVVRVMLDYVDHVPLCCKLKEVLQQQKPWPEIYSISTNPRSLKHLCRLKIRSCMGRLRLRCPVFMSFLPLPHRLKDYIQYKEHDLYGQRNMERNW
ncbi:ankyrin repeat and SOCS box protein 14 [Spea bombifrons]|uniref:ankyrin repeat and SOCS box protein 14 n=1 Tax=Spea bombifrons TaxID=233779 RepID=UPI00234B19CD|nr:ankyrin repeat and SOCS box protein 14 [Spea bombifrons]